MHSPTRSAMGVTNAPPNRFKQQQQDGDQCSILEMFSRTMMYPNNDNVTNRRSSNGEDAGRLMPRNRRNHLYPVVPDFDLSMENSNNNWTSSKKKQVPVKVPAKKKAPITSTAKCNPCTSSSLSSFLQAPAPPPPAKKKAPISLSSFLQAPAPPPPVFQRNTRRDSIASITSIKSSPQQQAPAPPSPDFQRNTRRDSITSIQSLPTDCSVEDLQAIQAALYEDEMTVQSNHAAAVEEEQASLALVQQLMKEEWALEIEPLPSCIEPLPSCVESTPAAVTTPADLNSSSDLSQTTNDSSAQEAEAAPPQKAVTKPAPPQEPKQQQSQKNRPCIYQLLSQLDEITVDVKTENWQMLAPHVLEGLELFTYDKKKQAGCNCTTTACSSSCAEENCSCLVCLTAYQEGALLRRLPCGHCFHQECVDPWLLQHDLCPVCRKTIDE